MIVKASHYESREHGLVRCLLCPAECLLKEGQAGICGCRINSDGKLIADNYGELVSLAYDPIEKKPLYHFYPGSTIFSTGPNGCNFGCLNCQNWQISQTKVPTRFVSAEDLVILARKNNSIGVAYTYSEPLIWFEYIMEAGRLIKEAGMKNVIVSNGYINAEPLKELLPVLDAANIDLKSMNPGFYKKICKGKLEPVLKTIETLFKAGVHLEITNLVITDLNDSDDDIKALVDFISGISGRIPLHFSAYYPTYKMDKPPTRVDRLARAYEIASQKLDYVYLGNVNIPERSNTLCPDCKTPLISRRGYNTEIMNIEGGKCVSCGCETGIIQ